jgi:hypothetical protein
MWLLGALLVWIALVLVWAMQPISDTVPTGIVKGVETTREVQCHSPLSGDTEPDGPVPTLSRPRAYERTPCETPIENGRTIFWVDVVLVVVGLVVLVRTWKPPSEPDGDRRSPEPTTTFA